MGTHAPQWFDGMIIGWPKVFDKWQTCSWNRTARSVMRAQPGWLSKRTTPASNPFSRSAPNTLGHPMIMPSNRFQEQVCHLSGRLLVAPVCRRRMVGRRRSGGLQDVPSPFAWSQRHLHCSSSRTSSNTRSCSSVGGNNAEPKLMT
jgi:hypothetical protein